jgi:hypothetical protein
LEKTGAIGCADRRHSERGAGRTKRRGRTRWRSKWR